MAPLRKSDMESSEWMLSLNITNNMHQDRVLLSFPVYRIVGGKTVSIRFSPISGSIFVEFEKNRIPNSPPPPESKDSRTFMRLTMLEWSTFEDEIPFIQRLIDAVESGKGDPEIIFGLCKSQWTRTDGEDNWINFTINVHNDMRLSFKYNMEQKACLVDLRKWFLSKDIWYPTKIGITLSARGFDYFAEHIVSRLNKAILMWTDVLKGEHYARVDSLFLPTSDTSDEANSTEQMNR